MSRPIMSKQMMQEMAKIYWHNHPDGSWEDFEARLDWVYEQWNKSINKVLRPSPLMAWLKSKGNIKEA